MVLVVSVVVVAAAGAGSAAKAAGAISIADATRDNANLFMTYTPFIFNLGRENSYSGVH